MDKEKRKNIIIGGVCFIFSLSIILIGIIPIKKIDNYIKNKSIEVVDIQKDAVNLYENNKDKQYTLKTDTFIYDINNNQLGHIYRNNYEYVEYKDISKEAIQAYKAIEDKRFDTHNGIDYAGIIRAAKYNFDSGSTSQGGSTITQQLIKNTIVGKEKSMKRKLKEFFIAPVIEKDKGKEWIIEKYLNTNYYGNNVNGIGYASKYYFGKTADKLTYKDTCLLIATTNGPTKYNPRRNPNITFEKAMQNYKILYEQGIISKEEYEKESKIPYELVYNKPQNTRTDRLTTLALYDATLELMKYNNFDFKWVFDSREDEKKYKENYYKVYKETQDRIIRGGYRIYTNIDKDIYNKTVDIVNNELSKIDNKIEASSIIIDNQTQYLLAATGGRKDDEFNRAFQALRQPGSLVKPLFVYPSSMETRLTTYSDYELDSKVEGDYSPQNVTGKYLGYITLRDAVARSINTVTYKTLAKTGLEAESDMMNRYKIASTSYPDYFNESISLGGLTRGWSPYEIAKAYSSLVNNGIRPSRNIIRKIEDEDGNVILDNGNDIKHFIPANNNEDIISLKEKLDELNIKNNIDVNNDNFRDVEQENSQGTIIMEPGIAQSTIDTMKYSTILPYGTSYRLKNLLKIPDEYASKTGTTTGSKDGWSVIITPRYTVLTWIGYDKPKRTNMYGSTNPTTISANIINMLYKDIKETMNFDKNKIVKLNCTTNNYITYVTDDLGYNNGSSSIEILNKRLEKDYDKYYERYKEEKDREEKEKEYITEEYNTNQDNNNSLENVNSEDFEKILDLENIYNKVLKDNGELSKISPYKLKEYADIIRKYDNTISNKYKEMIKWLEERGGMDENRRFIQDNK